MKDLHDKDTAIEFYDDRYEQGYMEDWDELKKKKVKQVILSLNLPSSGKALDFGCGNGVFTRILKDLLPGWDVFGVEISKTAIKNARLKNRDCIFFEISEAQNYKGHFDFIFSHHVIEHVQDITQTFQDINAYLKQHSSQLHILPCGNPGSYEYSICQLKINGIEKDKNNRFFFEEPGHLRRLTTDDFNSYEEKNGFILEKSFYSNQYFGAINWITKCSPRFVKMLTDDSDSKDKEAGQKLRALRRKLLPKTYLQFPYSKFQEANSKWQKSLSDYIKLFFLFVPSLISRLFSAYWQKKAEREWDQRKTEKNGSEMFLFYSRKA